MLARRSCTPVTQILEATHYYYYYLPLRGAFDLHLARSQGHQRQRDLNRADFFVFKFLKMVETCPLGNINSDKHMENRNTERVTYNLGEHADAY